MNHSSQPQDELRPSVPSSVPLLRLRRADREPIPPDRCLVGEDCLVCRWRREGLIPPVVEYTTGPVQ